MKVLDLLCVHGHGFEGWFASEDDFQGQLARALVHCPLCGSAEIRKTLSAPRLNLRSGRQDEGNPGARKNGAPGAPAAAEPSDASSPGPSADAPVANGPQQWQAAWMQLARKIVAATEDVGENFASEARRIHHGEAPERGIRGRASAEQAQELMEEGIAVLPLLLPEVAKETLQ